jgi:signal transduction histidine kinase
MTNKKTLSFHIRLFILFLSFSLFVLVLTSFSYNHFQHKRFITSVKDSFNRGKETVSHLIEKEMSDLGVVVQMASSDVLFRQQIQNTLQSDEDMGLGVSENENSLMEAFETFKSATLPFFKKYPILGIYNADGKLIFSKASQSFQEKSLNQNGFFSNILRRGQTSQIISSASKIWKENLLLSKKSKEGVSYLLAGRIINGPLNEIIGVVIVGVDLEREVFPFIEKSTGTQIETFNHYKGKRNIVEILEEGAGQVVRIFIDFKTETTSEIKGFTLFKNVAEVLENRKMESLKISALIIIVTILIALSLSWPVSKLLTRPLKILASEVASIKDGNFGQKVVIPQKDEFGQLADDFTDMSFFLKQTYDRLQNYNQELKESVDLKTHQLQEAYDQLKEGQDFFVQEEKMKALGQLVVGVAHEVNTPIGVSFTAAGHLEKKLSDIENVSGTLDFEIQKLVDDCRQASRAILDNLTRASELVKSFKMISADQVHSQIREFNLHSYLENIVQGLSPIIPSNVDVKFSCPADIQMTSHPGPLIQVITNLFTNAIDHGFKDIKNGEISMDVADKGEEVEIVVEDNGKGIDEKDVSKIFDPFFTTARGSGNTGLGLSISRNLVTQTLEGEVRVSRKTKFGQGAKFILTLPKVLQMNGA